ncbi:surfactin synthase thioesterase subunit [Paenibacillus phyllosphaerae]|uniref:Surfactin synthase thioesterase subunit n=1 Tax=Paenibacillus phyllosphaerae TaxID=274593 RepID=A0A7W5FPD6_9BACL|nr:alpha/beta fold hydrolase [Paenibacillus phyllosphaerae]MBB3112256.1 surfactin synthase thioesterase subunit [Paenibacillus phyllosphaerae]
MNALERDKWIRKYPATTNGASSRLLVLPHAGGSANYYWPLFAQLSTCGIDCMAIQYPGRQDRIRETMIDRIDDYADRIAEALEGLGDKPTMLLGHSMGALIGYDLLARHGRRLPFIDCFVASAHHPPRRQAPSRFARPMSDETVLAHLQALGGMDDELLSEPALLDMILPAVKNDLEAVDVFAIERLERLHVPILAVIGMEDKSTKREGASDWAHLTERDFRLAELPGGHFYFAHQPRELAGVIVQAQHLAGREMTS